MSFDVLFVLCIFVCFLFTLLYVHSYTLFSLSHLLKGAISHIPVRAGVTSFNSHSIYLLTDLWVNGFVSVFTVSFDR